MKHSTMFTATAPQSKRGTIVKANLLGLFLLLCGWSVSLAQGSTASGPFGSITCPNDITVNCGTNINDYEIVGYPVVTRTSNSESDVQGLVQVSYSDAIISDDNCTQVIVRTWTANFYNPYSGAESYPSVCTQVITVKDTQGPIIYGVSDINLECNQVVPFANATAQDACSEAAISVTHFGSHTGRAETKCVSTTAFGPGADWAIWLPVLATNGVTDGANFVFDDENGHFEQYSDGTARLYGRLLNTENYSQVFMVDFWFKSRRTWNEWSALGRNFKNDLNLACAANNRAAWSYYELVDGFSTLTGSGSLYGITLSLSHLPANHYFGFQVGEGANNKNCSNGMSGWFSYTGNINGQVVNGNGDVNVDLNCTPQLYECNNNDQYTYLYLAKDACYNSTIAKQLITILDQTAPTFNNCPADLNIQCPSEIASIPVPVVTAIDNCTEAGWPVVNYLGEVVIANEYSEDVNCEKHITRTWEAVDCVGNRSVCVQHIHARDTEAPVLYNRPAAEITVECNAIPAVPTLTAIDNCDPNPSISYYEQIEEGDCPGRYTIIREWEAGDRCYNYSTRYRQTVHVVDNTAPVFDAYDFYTHIECTEVPDTISAHDACSSVTVTIVEEQLNSGGCLGVLYRKYRATDLCGNYAEAVQYISIMDTTPPTFVGLPNDNTVQCYNFQSGYNSNVTGMDNCGYDVTVAYSEQMVATNDNCPNSYDVIRTWIATDFCENADTATRITHVIDTNKPWFVNFPADLTIECSDAAPAVVYPIALDSCDQHVDVVMSLDTVAVAGSCPNAFNVSRVFRGYDDCGNQVVETQTIHVRDTRAPIFSEQISVFTYECGATIPVVNPTVTDNCGMVHLTHVNGEIQGEYCYQYFIRTWTATDDCNNSSTFEQIINIRDTTPPTISGNPDITITCEEYHDFLDNNYANDGVYTNSIDTRYVNVEDYCYQQYSVYWRDLQVSGSCAGNYMRTYWAIDICGNRSADFIQIIHLTDETAPIITWESEDLNVECGNEYSVEAPVFADNCDSELTITSSVATTSSDSCTTVMTYTWTAKDNCNNSTTSTTVVTIRDTQNPYFTEVAPNRTRDCFDDAIYPPYATAADACDEDVEVTIAVSTIAGQCPNEYTTVYTYTATDDCGHSAIAYSYEYVVDEQAPIFHEGQQTNYTYECNATIPLIRPTAYDYCDPTVTFSYTNSPSQGNSCDRTFTRTWAANDTCGNTSYFAQTIRIRDTKAPIVNPYAYEITMPCDNISNLPQITAVDSCNQVIITFVDSEFSGGCAGRFVRTYTVRDNCGNTTAGIIQQMVTLTDAIPASAGLQPTNVSVECGQPTPAYTPHWYDNCDSTIDSTFTSVIFSESPIHCTTVYKETYTGKDNCNAPTTVIRYVTVSDNTAPYLQTFQNAYYDCSEEIPVQTEINAYDLCSEVTVTYADVTIAGECPSNYEIQRTWTATDGCQNYTSRVQHIYVSDTHAPYWLENQNEFYYECGTTIPVTTPVAMDDCSTFRTYHSDGTITYPNPEYLCEKQFDRTWHAVDTCGNVSVAFVQHIYIDDTTNPVLTGCPQDLVLDCNAQVPNRPNVTAYDACDGNLTPTYTERIIGDMPEEGSIADCGLNTPIRPIGNPCGYHYDWAMAMFNMPEAHRWYRVVSGNLVQYEGSVHLVAQLENIQRPGTGWNVDLWFDGGMDWAAWSTQGFPTSFKADCGAEAANHASWTYFLLQAGAGAELSGYGAYTGSMLNLVHAPANHYFGFQLGNGANNYNGADNGFGGWFSYSGTFRTQYEDQLLNVSGAGDFAFELDCCPDYIIEREWSVYDYCGHYASCLQTISFSSNTGGNGGNTTIASEAVVSSKEGSTVAVSPNPANSNATFTFKAAYAAKTSLEVFDMTGKKVADVFVGSVEAGAEYRIDFNVGNLATGVYTYRLTNGTEVKIERMIISK